MTIAELRNKNMYVYSIISDSRLAVSPYADYFTYSDKDLKHAIFVICNDGYMFAARYDSNDIDFIHTVKCQHNSYSYSYSYNNRYCSVSNDLINIDDLFSLILEHGGINLEESIDAVSEQLNTERHISEY